MSQGLSSVTQKPVDIHSVCVLHRVTGNSFRQSRNLQSHFVPGRGLQGIHVPPGAGRALGDPDLAGPTSIASAAAS